MNEQELLDAMRELYEVWAGSDEISDPVTLREHHLIRLIEKMRDIAAAHLKQNEREAKDEN